MTETAAATPNETRDTKLEIIMGREALDKLANSTVLVLGCGGVGSIAARHSPAAASVISSFWTRTSSRPAISIARPSPFTAPSASARSMLWKP